MWTDSLGYHLLVEYYGCKSEVVSQLELLRETMLEAARRANATIVAEVFHGFTPHGLSGVVVIAESHIAVHTWPEYQCASVDIFSCSEKMLPKVAEDFLFNAFGAESSARRELKRAKVADAKHAIGEM